MRVFCVLGLLASVLIGGCASSQTAPSIPPSVDVTGTWVGSWTGGSGNGQYTLHLHQSGAKVTGDVSQAAYQQYSGDLEGTVVGNELRYRLVSGRAGAELKVIGNQMTGYSLSVSGVRLQLQRQE